MKCSCQNFGARFRWFYNTLHKQLNHWMQLGGWVVISLTPRTCWSWDELCGFNRGSCDPWTILYLFFHKNWLIIHEHTFEVSIAFRVTFSYIPFVKLLCFSGGVQIYWESRRFITLYCNWIRNEYLERFSLCAFPHRRLWDVTYSKNDEFRVHGIFPLHNSPQDGVDVSSNLLHECRSGYSILQIKSKAMMVFKSNYSFLSWWKLNLFFQSFYCFSVKN